MDSIEEVLRHFGDGAIEKYNTSALFKNCVNSIANGESLYRLISKLIEIAESQGKEIEKAMLNQRVMYVVTTEERIEEIKKQYNDQQTTRNEEAH